MITKEQIAADKALCENATEGPWYDRPAPPTGEVPVVVHSEWRAVANAQHNKDSAFIARARTALPEYIAELEALRERIEQLEYVDLAGYLHNHGMSCTVEALATRRLLLDVLRGEQGERDHAERADAPNLVCEQPGVIDFVKPGTSELEVIMERITKLEAERAQWQTKADRYLSEKREEDFDEASATVAALDIALRIMKKGDKYDER